MNPPPDTATAAAIPSEVVLQPIPPAPSQLRALRSRGRLRGTAALLGPAFVAAVAYIDPGNFATNIAGGARYGFLLVWVIVMANLMAMLIQYLSAKVGIATGKSLPELCRDAFPRPVSWGLWAQAEVIAIATDLAEFVGAAIALYLLFGVPPLAAGLITAVVAFGILALQTRGHRRFELAIAGLLGIVFLGFLYDFLQVGVDVKGFAGGLIPGFDGTDSVLIAVGILGATVMPHNLYLHSSVVQTRRYDETVPGKREAVKFAFLDSTIALTTALFINASILIVAAATFHTTGNTEVAEIQDAYKLLTPLLGVTGASAMFAVALLASGQNSTLTGTLAGQIVMEGFLNLRIRPWLRRLITRAIAIVPAVIVAVLYGDSGTAKLLVLSQVILSLQLSFAVFPLVAFTSDRKKMGEFTNPTWLKSAAYLVAFVIASLNAWLLVQTFAEWIS